MWQHQQSPGRSEWFKEVKGGTFAEYMEAAQRRLAEHGFSEAFELHEDPKKQGGRETWIEYLEFEYWWLNRYSRPVQHFQRSHDDAWKDLVASGVLRDGETEERLLALQLEGDAASPPNQQSTLRRELIELFREQKSPYRDAKAAESRQTARIQWALSQMPKRLETPKSADQTRKRRRREDEDMASEKTVEYTVAKKQKKEPVGEEDGGVPRPERSTVTTKHDPSTTPESSSPASALISDVKDGKRRNSRTEVA